jgi:hypothetical protein
MAILIELTKYILPIILLSIKIIQPLLIDYVKL